MAVMQAATGMLSDLDIALRLGVATIVGVAIGLNRDLHGKPTGIRTLGLVGLGSALVVLAASDFGGSNDVNAPSRAIQGVITGIGFLGAGVILKDAMTNQVHGLTTAASIWLTSCLGIVCGFGAWRTASIALLITFVLLVFGGPIEKRLHARFGDHPTKGPPA